MPRNPPKKIAIRLTAEHFKGHRYTDPCGCGLWDYLNTRFGETNWRWRVSDKTVRVWTYYVTVDGKDLLNAGSSYVYPIPKLINDALIDRHNPIDDDYLKTLKFTLVRG